MISVDCPYDMKMEGEDKTECLLQVSKFLIFQVEGHKNHIGIWSTCMNLESYDHCIRLRQLQGRSPK